MKPDKLCASKIQWWDRQKTDISIPKGDIGRKTGVTIPKQVQNLIRPIPLDLNAWALIFFGLMLHSPGTLGGTLILTSLGRVASPTQLCWALIPPLKPWLRQTCPLGLCTLVLWWEWHPWWSVNHLQGHSSLFLKDKACLQPNFSIVLSCSLWFRLTVSLMLWSWLYS